MSGIFVQLLRAQFGSRDQIVNENLKDNVWSPDVSKTNILIEAVHNLKIENLAQRPGILARRNEHKAIQNIIGMGEQAAELPKKGEGVIYNQLWVGSTTVFGIGRSGAEAEILAEEAGAALRQFAPIIRGDFEFLRFSVLAVGAVGKLQESDEHFVVPVTFGYGFWETWTLHQESPILMKFEVKTAVE